MAISLGETVNFCTVCSFRYSQKIHSCFLYPLFHMLSPDCLKWLWVWWFFFFKYEPKNPLALHHLNYVFTRINTDSWSKKPKIRILIFGRCSLSCLVPLRCSNVYTPAQYPSFPVLFFIFVTLA